MPDLIDILKTEEIDNIFEEMKLLYDEYSGIFQNDSILEPYIAFLFFIVNSVNIILLPYIIVRVIMLII